MHFALLILAFLVTSNAHGENDSEQRLGKVEAVAEKNPNFFWEHDLLVEARSDCGSGESYYVPKGRFSDVELNWLRQLLHFRFNGTSVTSADGERISFEEGTGVEVSDGEMQNLLASNEFSKWVGSELVRLLSSLTSDRAELKSRVTQLPKSSEAFFRDATYKRYSLTASKFQRQVVDKFKIIVMADLVDCD